jgi:thiamine pyrophosphokinase
MPAEERVQEETVIVVGGGGDPDAPVPFALPVGAVVAADGGVDRALALGLQVDLAVGDFDSATHEALTTVRASGATVERHPADKDATDLELALDAALGLGATRILVVGHDGGRLDHLLAGLLVLCHERYAGVTIDAYLGAARAHVCRGTRELEGAPRELVSLVPVLGPAGGVSTAGLRWPLANETLEPGTSRGVSNEVLTWPASVTVARGVVLALFPGVKATA